MSDLVRFARLDAARRGVLAGCLAAALVVLAAPAGAAQAVVADDDAVVSAPGRAGDDPVVAPTDPTAGPTEPTPTPSPTDADDPADDEVADDEAANDEVANGDEVTDEASDRDDEPTPTAETGETASPAADPSATPTSAEASRPDDAAAAQDAADPLTVDFDAIAVTTVEPGLQRVDYEIVVRNDGDLERSWDLDAAFDHGAGLVVEDLEPIVLEGPGVTIDPDFDGVDDTRLLDGTQALAPGTRVFVEVRAFVRVPDDLDLSAGDCEGDPTGYRARAILTPADAPARTSVTCASVAGEIVDEEAPQPTVTVRTELLTVDDDGLVTVVSNVEVTNPDTRERTVELSHWLNFGDGIEILSATAEGPEGVVDADWTGARPDGDDLFDGQQVVAAGTTVTVRVTVVVDPGSLVVDGWLRELDCRLDVDEDGTGLRTATTLNADDTAIPVEEIVVTCPDLPVTVRHEFQQATDGGGTDDQPTLPRTGAGTPWLGMFASLLLALGVSLRQLGRRA